MRKRITSLLLSFIIFASVNINAYAFVPVVAGVVGAEYLVDVAIGILCVAAGGIGAEKLAEVNAKNDYEYMNKQIDKYCEGQGITKTQFATDFMQYCSLYKDGTIAISKSAMTIFNNLKNEVFISGASGVGLITYNGKNALYMPAGTAIPYYVNRGLYEATSLTDTLWVNVLNSGNGSHALFVYSIPFNHSYSSLTNPYYMFSTNRSNEPYLNGFIEYRTGSAGGGLVGYINNNFTNYWRKDIGLPSSVFDVFDYSTIPVEAFPNTTSVYDWLLGGSLATDTGVLDSFIDTVTDYENPIIVDPDILPNITTANPNISADDYAGLLANYYQNSYTYNDYVINYENVYPSYYEQTEENADDKPVPIVPSIPDNDFGNINDYTYDLKDVFPFCIPFDIGNLLKIFKAEPIAPRFEYVITLSDISDTFEDYTIVIDFSQFDTMAGYLRIGLNILFILGLAWWTRFLLRS